MTGIKRINRTVIVLAVLALLVGLLTIRTAYAAALTSVSDVLSPVTVSTAAQHTITFTAPTLIPTDGKIKITASDFTSWPANGAVTVTVKDDTVTVTQASATSTQADEEILIVLNASAVIASGSVVVVTIPVGVGIVNPATTGNYLVRIETQDNASTVLDTGSALAAVGGNNYVFAITGGTASLVAIVPASEAGVTLDGSNKISTWTSVEDTDDWTVTDNRGTGAGWTLTVASGSLSDGRSVDSGVMTLNETSTLFTDNDKYAVKVKVVKSTTASGNQGIKHETVNNGSTTSADIAGTTSDGFVFATGTGVTVVTAEANEGMGVFSIIPVVQVHIPSGAYANTAASFSLTVTLILN